MAIYLLNGGYISGCSKISDYGFYVDSCTTTPYPLVSIDFCHPEVCEVKKICKNIHTAALYGYSLLVVRTRAEMKVEIKPGYQKNNF